MKFTFCCLFIAFLSVAAHSQIITTVAGTPGVAGNTGDGGPATNATLNTAYSVAADRNGNFYISDNSAIRKVSAAGIISAFAGNGIFRYDADTGDGGPATAVPLAGAYALSTDKAGNVYFSSSYSIRKVDPAGILSTVAGRGFPPNVGAVITSGVATATPIHPSLAVYTDTDGRVFYIDSNIVMMVDTFGMLHHYAGDGTTGFSGDGGPATAASINPGALAGDALGNIYFCEYTGRVRKIAPSGIITTVAGNGTNGHSGDGGPATAAKIGDIGGAGAISVDRNGDILIAEYAEHYVRKVSMSSGIITSIAGIGTAGFSGDGGPATAAKLNIPFQAIGLRNGKILIADAINYCVRQISAPTTTVDEVAVQQGYSIYPSPTYNGRMYIGQNTARTVPFRASLFSIDGRRVQTVDCNGNTNCELNWTGKGLYLLTIDTEPGVPARLVEFR